MADKWKPDSSKPREIPKQFAEYIWRKKRDFIGSMFFGVVGGVALTTAVLHFHGGIPITAEMVIQQVVYSSALVIGISIMSKMKY